MCKSRSSGPATFSARNAYVGHGMAHFRTTYARTLSMIRDDVKFLIAEDKSWILSRTVEQVWPFT